MKADFTNLKLYINNEEIDRIGNDTQDKYFKFVGIRLDENLSWDYHTNHVHSKLASGCFAISSVKNFLPRSIRLTMYNSFFRSHCEFGIMAWGGVRPSKLKKICKLQKKCVRNVIGKGHRAHCDPIFSALELLKFEDLFKFNCSSFMHKYTYGKAPSSFQNFFIPVHFPNRTKSYMVQKYKNEFLTHFPSYFLINEWNANAQKMKLNESHNSFKKSLELSLFSKYPAAVKCNSRGCTDCFPPVIYLAR